MTENEIAKEVVDAAYKIHTRLGPGLLESIYETLLAHELGKRGLTLQTQHPVKVIYEGIELESAYRADIIVNRKLIIEVKSIEAVTAVHRKQLLTYLKLSDLRLGLLINFNVALIKDGITRIANNLDS